MSIYAIILSAGFSTRMSIGFKPLLPLPFPSGAKTSIEALCTLYHSEKIKPIIVGGYKSEHTKLVAAKCDADFVLNNNPEKGMFSSIFQGVKNLPPDCEAFFIHPVDIPLVRRMTIKFLLNKFERENANAYIPIFLKKEGHPPLLSAPLKRLIEDGSDNLHHILTNIHKSFVPTADSFILNDMDTETDYHDFCEKSINFDILTPEEAKELLNIHNISDKGKAHGLSVGKVAAALAQEISKKHEKNKKKELEENIAFAGGLVHDICKGIPNHEKSAGKLLRSYGLNRMAYLVEDHCDLSLPADQPISERELIYLADKFTKGNRVISIKERFTEKIKLYEYDPSIQAAITARMQRAIELRDRFAAECGSDPEMIARETLNIV